MEQYFYLDSNNQRQGPVDADKLPDYGVKPSTLVWKTGMDDWAEAAKIPELADYFIKRAESVPPPPPQQPQRPQPSYQQPYFPTEKKPDNLLIWSILSTVLCCLPLGIVAIIYSNKVDNMWNAKNYEGAREAAKNARLFCFLSLGLGILTGIFYFILGMIGALS